MHCLHTSQQALQKIPSPGSVCEEGRSLSKVQTARAEPAPSHKVPKPDHEHRVRGFPLSAGPVRSRLGRACPAPQVLPVQGWESLSASADFPVTCSASNLGKEKPSQARHHPGNAAHPSPLPKLVFTASLRPGQRVLPSPAQCGMCIHSLSSVHRNCISAPHRSCGFPPPPIRQP